MNTYEIINWSISEFTPNGDGTITYTTPYSFGLIGEKYLPNASDGCKTKLSDSLSASDTQSQLLAAVNSDLQTKYPPYS